MGNCVAKLFPPRKDGTAQGVAKYRYMELLQPDADKRLFVDPYAYAYVIGSPIIKFIGYEYCHSQSDLMISGMWESLICRQIFIDEEVRKGVVEGGATQIVIFGAGYDNRFYRLNCCNSNGGSDMTLIEVDQPEVQELKKKGLKSMGIIRQQSVGGGEGNVKEEDEVESFKFISPTIDESIIELGKSCKIDFNTSDSSSYGTSVHFCPCNFETMNLKEQILKTPFDSKKKTIFIMEGLTQYVEKGALEETIRTINDVCDAPGSKIIITYVDSRLFDNDKVRDICAEGGAQMKKLLAMLEQKEEPWITSFDVEGGGDGKDVTFEMKKWLSTNTNGMFSKNYIDQSWDEFCEKELVPKGRHVYQFGKKSGDAIPKWAVERHACITRK